MSLEANVISAVCKNKDIGTVLADNVDELFVSHRDVWEGLKRYYYKYNAVPEVSILEGRFQDFTGNEDIKGDTKYHLDDLKDNFIKSRVKNIFLDRASELKSNAGAEILEKTIGELGALTKFTDSVRDLDLTDFEDAEKHYKAQAERAKLRGGTPGIATGFASIDASYPTGMAPGHLIVAIGWPGRGKTWFTSYLACKAWERGYKPMIVSLEMSPEQMRDRIYTMMGNGLFRNSEFSRGDVNIDEFHTWADRRFARQRGFVLISSEGAGGVTPNTVQGKIEQHRPDLVILDYHQLFDDNKHSKNEVERGGNVSREFKLLAVNNNIPVIDITAATMDDVTDQDSPPMLSQVRWSKSIEYDADVAFAVHKNKDSNLIEVVSRKNRHGDDFGFYLDWDIDRGIINEVYGD